MQHNDITKQSTSHSVHKPRQPVYVCARSRGTGYRKTQRVRRGTNKSTSKYRHTDVHKPVHSERRPYADKPTQSSTEIRTTKSKYRSKEIIKDMIEPNEVHIEDNGSVKEYVNYALDLLDKKKETLIYITATNGAIEKAINCVEIIKRKKTSLHQETRIESKKIKEIWEPLEYYLKNVIIEYDITYIKVLLTFDCELVNKHAIGYQTPIALVVSKVTELKKQTDAKEEELGYVIKLYKNLQHKYDMQQKDFVIYMDKMNNNQIMGKFNELQNQYDVQNEELAMMCLMRERCVDDCKCLKSKYDKQVDKYNVLENKYEKLKERLNVIKTNKYYDLNASQLVEFIVNIDKNRYNKYRHELLKGFIDENVDGSCLNYLTKDDLYRFGVIKYCDKIAMYNSIKNLFKQAMQ